eukprot:12446075-Alexandrium_andersonii.AAC.1
MFSKSRAKRPTKEERVARYQSYRPSSRGNRVSGIDPISQELPGAPQSSAELLGALRNSPVSENAELLEAFEA